MKFAAIEIILKLKRHAIENKINLLAQEARRLRAQIEDIYVSFSKTDGAGATPGGVISDLIVKERFQERQGDRARQLQTQLSELLSKIDDLMSMLRSITAKQNMFSTAREKAKLLARNKAGEKENEIQMSMHRNSNRRVTKTFK